MFVWRIFRKKLIKVECWFCQASTTVPVGNVNCFDCPECDQYNGFSKDGGYNKAIPAQYSEELNQTYSSPGPPRDDSESRPSPLCDVCQTNQELKVQQLAAFVPSHEKNFDVDVKEYSDYLEEAYRLCPACNDNICSEVYRQDADIRSKLLGQRLHQSVLPDTKVVMPAQSSQKCVFLCRAVAIVAAVLVFICQLSLHVDYSGLSRTKNAVFMQKAFQHLAALESRRMSLSLMGLVCGVLSSLIAGKYRYVSFSMPVYPIFTAMLLFLCFSFAKLWLRHLDCVSPLLWMMYMGSITALPSSSSLLALFPWLPSDAIPMMLATCVLLCCSKHVLQSRERKVKKVFTNKRLRSQPTSPLQEEDCFVLPHPSDASSSTALSSLSLSQSLQSENGEIKRILLDQDISGLSLGPPALAKAKNKDLWTAHTPPTSRPATPLLEDRPSSREFRPIISPATFNPSGMKRSTSQTSFVSSFNGTFIDSGPFQDQRVTSSRENLGERGRSPPSFGDDSSDGSLPLCMSANESPDAPTAKHTQAWTSCLLPGILGFSLGINCAAALYFMYGR